MNNCKKNFGFEHKSGILMAVSSLPSPYGIGTFGAAAYKFIDLLDECGQTCWQVLPLNPTSYGDSPYQSPASVAGNPYFIDLDILCEKGLLSKSELADMKRRSDRVDYGWLFNTRYPLFRLAFSRFESDAEFVKFCREQDSWLDDYALFMALKVKYNFGSWTQWAPEHRDVVSAREHRDELREEMLFWKWLQYEFMTQWANIRAYAHGKGISIIGDMPIYVAHDSMDVWRAPSQFLLDEDYYPTLVAGCPPDAYSEIGQLWGNPIYDWDGMKKDGFAWWIDRVGHSFELYDLLRIDHFRGFASYYTIPAGEETALNGSWKDAPGKELFDAIRNAFPDAKIIAEDLGFITDDVRELLSYTDFPGMKVLQFAFYTEDSEYLPRTYTTDNCIVYTSSHDSDCTASWYKSLDEESLKRFKTECPIGLKRTPTDALIEMAMRSRANLAVIALQDYMRLTNEQGRMNIPSVADGNWSWRARIGFGTKCLKERITMLTKAGDRMK